MSDDYYPVDGFRYRFKDIILALQYHELFEDGKHPQPPSNYNDLGVRIDGRRASDMAARDYIWTIKMRLDLTGDDGKAAWFYYAIGIPFEDIAEFKHWDYNETSHRANRAIAFCCGWKRKTLAYQEWVNHRRAVKIQRTRHKDYRYPHSNSETSATIKNV